MTTVTVGAVIERHGLYTGAIVGLFLGIISALMTAYMKLNTEKFKGENFS